MIQAQRGQHAILIAPVSGSAASTARLDTNGADYATIDVALSAEITTDAEVPVISLLSSDDTVVTNFATMVADVTGDDVTAARLHTYHIDLRGQKRYIRLTITPGTVVTDDAFVVSANSSLTRKVEAPGATGDMSDLATII